jgi:hypothetical protein
LTSKIVSSKRFANGYLPVKIGEKWDLTEAQMVIGVDMLGVVKGNVYHNFGDFKKDGLICDIDDGIRGCGIVHGYKSPTFAMFYLKQVEITLG